MEEGRIAIGRSARKFSTGRRNRVSISHITRTPEESIELDFTGKALRLGRSGDRFTVFVVTLSFSGYFYAEGLLSCTTENCQINFILDVIEKRDENLPTVFSPQFNPKDWYVRLGESTQCESVLQPHPLEEGRD